MKYAVVFEKAPENYAAYVPDLPGCITTGKTLQETERNIREAITFYLESLREHDEPIPEPTTTTTAVEIDFPPVRASA